MAITSVKQLDPNGTYTYADYLTWRFEQMVEIIKGKLFIMSPAPASKHQQISMVLTGEMYLNFRNQPCKMYTAPFDVRLVKGKKNNKDIITVVQPDICVICDENKIDEKGCLGSPDWIIEILSPSTAKKDYNEKYNLYEENKVKEYWIVNPDANTVNQYVLNKKGKYIDAGFYGRNDKIKSGTFSNVVIDLKMVFK
ncbi:MAG: Uma2 family endonuclease [Ferruginibacter sp.]|nr:Uma2 family endonuclease [Ferruginibacter sp.]